MLIEDECQHPSLLDFVGFDIEGDGEVGDAEEVGWCADEAEHPVMKVSAML